MANMLGKQDEQAEKIEKLERENEMLKQLQQQKEQIEKLERKNKFLANAGGQVLPEPAMGYGEPVIGMPMDDNNEKC